MSQKRCVNCGELIDLKAEFCPFCSAKQPATEYQDEPEQKSEQRDAKKVSPEKVHELEVEVKKLKEKEKAVDTTRDEETGLRNFDEFKKALLEEHIGKTACGCIKGIEDDISPKNVAVALAKTFGDENVFRVGSVFMVVRPETTEAQSMVEFDELREKIKNYGRFAIGYSVNKNMKTAYNTAIKEAEKDLARIKSERKMSGYDPNSDGYYNDVEAVVEAEEKELSKQMILKVGGIIAVGIVVVIIMMLVL